MKKFWTCLFAEEVSHVQSQPQPPQQQQQDFRNRVQAQLRKVMANGSSRQQKQELSLGLTLVSISVLFIVCQSVKLVPDLYELFCSSKGITSQSTSGHVTCHSTHFIDTLIRYAHYLDKLGQCHTVIYWNIHNGGFHWVILIKDGKKNRLFVFQYGTFISETGQRKKSNTFVSKTLASFTLSIVMLIFLVIA